MGVPKFFRYISERYPCINVRLKEHEIPEFDNFYLDMNGIIHNCSHDDNKLAESMSEEQIFRNIFYYTELLFRMIQPKKLFMMAVDGVAPRAKMNQQRGRRFRSAKDAEDAAKRLENEGKPVPVETFDSNCITPGTEFMARLHDQFQYFIAYKISTDKLWQIPKIVYSGHNVPGEGEHKIMDYIRFLKTQSCYDPNIKHCLHGLDADLIMLGLCTHEPNFCILREEVIFNKKQKRPKNPENIVFQLLHLSLLRDYIDLEFQKLKNSLPFDYDLEKIIDDWVLMGFLVGNDFVPNIPSFYIAKNGLDMIYDKYNQVLPSLGGYINNNGTLNLERFEKFLDTLASWEFELFKENFSGPEGLAEFEEANERAGNLEKYEMEEIDGKPINMELLGMIQNTEEYLEVSGDEDDLNSDDDLMRAEFNMNKKRYYMAKFDEKLSKEEVSQKAEEYIRAVVWILGYYYNGCQSWSWFYPFHYTPQLSDLIGFSNKKFDFPDDKPFQPFQQLLAVLPSGSKTLLPPAFQNLVTSEDSPIFSYYPKDFELDMNGKQNEWEAIVLLPFIDEETLLSAMAPHVKDLTPEEMSRNEEGPMMIAEYSSENLGVYKSVGYFPDIPQNHAKVVYIPRQDVLVQLDKLIRGLNPNFKSVQPYGFPRLKHIPFKAELAYGEVKVFSFGSKQSNMLLYIKNRNVSKEMDWPEGDHYPINKKIRVKDPECDGEFMEYNQKSDVKEEKPDPDKVHEVAERLLGNQVFSFWPHLSRTLVVSVCTLDHRFFKNQAGAIEKKTITKQELMVLSNHISDIEYINHTKLGIYPGDINIIIYAKTLEGTKYTYDSTGKATKVYNWSNSITAFPYQLIVMPNELLPKDVAVEEELNNIFKIGSVCFFLGSQYYGAKAEVVEMNPNGKIKVEIDIQTEPDFSNIKFKDANQADQFLAVSLISQIVGIHPMIISKITGVIYVTLKGDRKRNIGLNLKFNKQNKEVLGYTKKFENKYWKYSEAVTDILKEYRNKFPKLFHYLEDNVSNDKEPYQFEDIYGEEAKIKLDEITSWISNKHEELNINDLQREVGSQLLSKETTDELIKLIQQEKNNKSYPVIVVVKPTDLYIPEVRLSLKCPDLLATHEMLDRIVFVRDFHPIPVGTKGTIIGWHSKKEEETIYDILFDEVLFAGFISSTTAESRVYQLTKQSFINISHGIRMNKSSKISLKPESLDLSWRSRWQPQTEKPSHANQYEPPENRNNSGFFSRKDSSQNQSSSNYQNNYSNRYGSNRTFEPRRRFDDKPWPELPNNGMNTVSKFFSAYKTSPTHPLAHNAHQGPHKLSADSEFQAMWSHLQQNKVPERAVDEQTNALKKILKLRDEKPNLQNMQQHPLMQNIRPQILMRPLAQALPHMLSIPNLPPQPLPRLQAPPAYPCSNPPSHVHHRPLPIPKCAHDDCISQLLVACQQLNIALPSYSYRENTVMNLITCRLYFNDGSENINTEACNKIKATQLAACQALKRLEKEMEIRRKPLLPSPPEQWRQNMTNETSNVQTKFVPLQVQKSISKSNKKPSSQISNDIKMDDNQKHLQNEPERPSQDVHKSRPLRSSRRGRGRIAAKFSVPID